MYPEHEGDDTFLVEACINKDGAAWATLVKKYSGLISASIANRLKKCGFDPLFEETEDIRQDLLASIWTKEKLAQIKNRKSIAHWLSIVSGNAAIEHMRKKLADKNPKLIPLTDTPEPDNAPPAPERSGEKELSETIEFLIASLPAKERLITKLNIFHGMGYREIADMLNIPKGTVSSYIKRAKEKLRKKLKKLQ